MLISSRQNPTIKRLSDLREAKGRREQGRFLIDGPREIERAIKTGKKLLNIYSCANYDTPPELRKALLETKVPITDLSKPAFDAVCYRENPVGKVVEAQIWDTTLGSLKKQKYDFVIVAEDIEKPGNLGTLLRTADAVGAQAIIGCNPTVDLFNPNTLRASAGAAFSVPYATATLPETLAWLKQQGLTLVATSPAATESLWSANLKQPVAIAVGSEADGLSPELIAAAQLKVSLPMMGIGDSLNVSVACGAILYEALRQRRP